MPKKIIVFVLSILASSAAGAIGSLATSPNIKSWYQPLEKPPLVPPNWVFGPVWSLLYVLMGVALALVILQVTQKSKMYVYYWFAAQLFLNTLWSLVFFGLHSLWFGVAIILLLIFSISMTIRFADRITTYAAWLLVPYLAWVCFATYLNIGVALLN